MPDFTALGQLHFLRPWWLLGIPIGIACMVYLSRERDSIGKWAPIIAPHLARAMLVRGTRGHRLNPVSVSTIILLLGIIALAGPSWQRQPSPFVEDKAVLVITLDLSGSMKQRDVQPSRLERARQKIEDLIKLRAGARTGLIVYAGSAHSVIPLTNDPDILRNFLAAVEPDMMPRAGKFAERALPIADRMLRDSELPGTILVVADSIGPRTEQAYSDYFSQNDHQLLVLGIGRQAGDKGIGDKDIPLQREALKSLARAAGGYYQDLSLDTGDVERLNRRINQHLLNVEDSSRPWVDFGYYLLFPLAFIFLIGFRKGWTLHWGLAAVIVLAAGTSPNAHADDGRFIDLWLTPDQQGRYYFERGDYGTAAQRFQDTPWRGVAYYLDENFSAAAETFAQIESAEGLFNLANAWAQSQNYVYAVRAYDRLLALEPDHPGALKNRAIVQTIIDDINRMSESQQGEPGEQSKELGDEPLRAEGADKEEWGKKEIVQLSADEILADERIRELWLRQVQQDPSTFLSIKFLMQLQQEDADDSPPAR
jgi:Ca-activated chloride channel family protein